MNPSTVLIVSRDADFAQSLSEQVTCELSLACQISSDYNPASAPALIVAHEAVEGAACPVLVVKNPPFKMHSLLSDISASLQVDNINLGSGYELRLRQKQLARADKTVDVTDKEAGLLQCLAGAKPVAKEQLLKTVWGIESALDTHTLETHIYRLRGKFRELGDDDMVIATDGGYQLKA